VRFCSQKVRICIDRVSFPSLIVPCTLLLPGCAFLHQQVSFPSLIIPCAFLLTGSAFLHRQSLIPVADHPLRVSAHRWCISASTASHSHRWSSPVRFCSQMVRSCIDRASFPSLIVPCAFLLTGRVFLHRHGLIPVANRPLRVSAHRKCVPVSTKSHSCR